MDNGASSYRRFLDGDEKAFDEIMNGLFFGLVDFINGYVHNAYDAEDIAMDCFSDLIVDRKKYNFKVSLKTYLYMLGKSRALNYLKHKKILEFTDIAEAGDIKDEQSKLEEKVLENDRKRIIAGALEKLPDDMRTAVHLIYFEDMTYEEAAKIMKKNKKQLDNLLYRAKKELRAILGKECDLL